MAASYGVEELEPILANVGNRDKALQMIDEMRGHLAAAAEFTDLPHAEALAKWTDLFGRTKGNPFAQAMLPAFEKLQITHTRMRVREAMFKAAFAIVESGPEALKNYPDPFDGALFEYRKTDAGFELVSKFRYKNQTESLTVGPKKKWTNAESALPFICKYV